MIAKSIRIACLMLACVAAGPHAARAIESVLNSKHDLTPVGPGPIRANTEREICAFCHTPHRAFENTPLWSHELSSAAYIPYSSSTVKATIGQPTGSSKLCLSCHDGTVALGMIANRPSAVDMAGGVITMPPGPSNLGTDLSDDHPISFRYDGALAAASGELRDPTALDERVRLDHQGEMQCTSCHDPHNNQYGKFLVMANDGAELCIACHDKAYWLESTHRSSAATWDGNGANPWPRTGRVSVGENSCESCHAPHNAGMEERLLTHETEEGTCYVCHNGHVAAKDVEQEFQKLSVHPVDITTRIHDPLEELVNPPRHVECVDCHNPHASRDAAAVAPNASGRLAGVAGIDANGATVDPIQREYELCFRCHGDSAERGPARVTRQFVQTNSRLDFAPSGASYHPVVAAGKNPDVPSLIAPMQWSSLIYCTDCHRSDNPDAPRGPHGSQFVPILVENLQLNDFQVAQPSTYALCYRCHDRRSIENNDSFPMHWSHIRDHQTACTTCHDPHGVNGVTHLINFNTTYVGPSASGRLEFVDTGRFQGACFLTCHGANHDPREYPLPLTPAPPLP